MNVFKKCEQLKTTLPIIISGQIDYVILRSLGKSEKWLKNKVENRKLELKDILGACLIDNELSIVDEIKI